MSKLYCEILESARKTVPTARAHTKGCVSVKNWKFAVEVTMIDRGGGDLDTVRIELVRLDNGERMTISHGSLAELCYVHR